MSTVVWLPSSGAAPVSPTPEAGWGHQSGNSRVMNFTRGATALTTLAYNPDVADHLVSVDSLICQFVSQVLPPQTVPAQNILLNLLMLEAAASNNLFLTWKLYGCNVAGSSNLGNLLALARGASLELGTALTGQGSVRASTAQTFNEPWRLVLEVGAGGTPTNLATDTHNASAQFGEAMATGTHSLPQHADTTTGGVPFMLFSNDLKTSFDGEGAAFGLGI